MLLLLKLAAPVMLRSALLLSRNKLPLPLLLPKSLQTPQVCLRISKLVWFCTSKYIAHCAALAEAFGARLLDLCAAWAQARASVQSRAAELTRSATTDLLIKQEDADATAAFEAIGPVCAPPAACVPVSYDSVLTQYDSSWVQHWTREGMCHAAYAYFTTTCMFTDPPPPARARSAR
jgi:hypothetical protein